MRIGELAARAGVSRRALRYYEEQGLLTSTRSSSGQRLYGESEVLRVAFLRRLYDAGLSSRTITELLPCVDSPGADTSEAAIARMTDERDRLSQHLADLAQTRNTLEDLIAAARSHREASADTCLTWSGT